MPLRKRSAAALLCAAAGTAVLSCAAPSLAAAAPAAPAKSTSAAPHSSAIVRPNTIVFPCWELFTFRVVANIRSGAGLWNSIVGHGYPGQEFEAQYETSYSYSGYRWVEGYDINTGVGGWVAVQLLTDHGSAGCTVLM